MHEDLLHRGEVFLAYSADGTYPVGRNVFEGGSRGDSAVGISHYRVILIPANVANVLFHNLMGLKILHFVQNDRGYRPMVLKKSLPLSSTMPRSGYSTHSMLLMPSLDRTAAGPPMEPR